jgi:DNA-binding NarL/FixJ family response regulator
MLLDYNLPDGDGIEVLNQLRNDCGEHPCAIVILTAYGGEELAVRAMKAGASDYLPKGRLSADALPRTVAHAIKEFRMHQQIEQQSLALIVSQRRYRDLLEAIPQMVWTANPDGLLE